MSGSGFGRFSDFYSRHSGNLWRYLVRIGADPALAEDLRQEAFVRWSLSRAVSWDDERSRAYLFTIGTRLLTDWWRRRNRHSAWEEACEPCQAAEISDSPLFRSRAWEALSRRQQQLLWLAYVEEFSHIEIASICGIAPGSVRVLLSRGRALLAEKLTEDRKKDFVDE